MTTILIAEDDKLLHKIYRKILESEDYELTFFDKGADALKSFREKPADMVIIDMILPDLRGDALCLEIRKLPMGERVPIVIVSGHDDEDKIMSGLNAGANDYILKPLRPSELKTKIARFAEYSRTILHRDADLALNKTVIFGRYQIEAYIGHGRHSVVYAAIQVDNPAARFAVKAFHPDVTEDDKHAEMTLANAGKLKAIHSDALLGIYDYGRWNDRDYLVMEYADKGSLKRHIEESGHLLDLRQAATLGGQIVEAIKVLKANGLDRSLDIKPDNIMLIGDRFKLGDLGAFAPTGADTEKLGQELWGTVDYLPPEQIAGDNAHAPFSGGNLYSLGITIYQALTGQNPFQGETAAKTLYSHLHTQPPPLRQVARGIPETFSTFIERCLDKDPQKRPSLDEAEAFFTAFYRDN